MHLELLCTYLILCTAQLSTCLEYCVVDNENFSHEEPCQSLDYYIERSWILSNQYHVELQFWRGNHILKENLIIENVSFLSLIGYADAPEDTQIQSGDQNYNFFFLNISSIEIINIAMIGELTELYSNEVPATRLHVIANRIYLYKAILFAFKATVAACSMQINASHILYCRQFEICGFSSLHSEFVIHDSVIEYSQIGLWTNHDLCTGSNHSFIIRASILTGYLVLVENSRVTRADGSPIYLFEEPVNFSVESSLDFYYTMDGCQCSGFSIALKANNSAVFLNIQNTNFVVDEEKAWYEAPLVSVYVDKEVQSSDILFELLHSSLSKASVALGLHYYSLYSNHVTFNIFDCALFDSYMGTSISFLDQNLLTLRSVKEHSVINISIKETIFRDLDHGIIIENYKYSRLILIMVMNKASFFGLTFEAVSVSRVDNQFLVPLSDTPLIKLYFKNSSFEYCHQTAITVEHTDVLLIDNCTFCNNKQTSIVLYFSDITLLGNVVFSNNSGVNGGAMSLDQSFLQLGNETAVVFEYNHAENVGGAIYIHKRKLYKSTIDAPPPCFFQLSSKNFKAESFLSDVRITSVVFSQNTALKGGDNVFGGKLSELCVIYLYNHYINLFEKQFVNSIFRFIQPTLSSVSSHAMRVCLCDSEGFPKCGDSNYIQRTLMPKFPGEEFTISVVIVGYEFGTIPGFVYASLNEFSLNVSLSSNQHVQEIGDHTKCSILTFTILSNLIHQAHHLKLYVENGRNNNKVQKAIRSYNKFKTISDALLKSPVEVIVQIKDCPPGFSLSSTAPFFCTCHQRLTESGVKVCVIFNHTGQVYRSGTVWVSSISQNQTNSFVVNTQCPYHYCLPGNISVDLNHPDVQCAFNHSGVLCGGCSGNLSLALGSSRCLVCDNSHVYLFFLFAIAGFALVLFIKLLDMTIAKGTLGGLIFYANILWTNKSIFFPFSESLHPVQHVLQVFIAWLNLDFGIETCFLNGLNSYWKTWLQFVFPLYIWSIVGIMIFTARYSTKAVKLFGNNSVPVLATLILLSYAKLLRTIITSIGFSVLNYPSGPNHVWSFDANVIYFSPEHSVLFFAAIVALLVFWMPFTFALVSLQWLKKYSYLKIFRWINHLKPFFDAYTGQLKPKHHYWVGLLLLIRVFVLVTFSITSAILPQINVICIAIIGTCLFIYTALVGMVYKSLALSLLEHSFIVNLTFLALINPYISGNAAAIYSTLYTSVGVVFCQFWGLVFFHLYERIKLFVVTYKRRHKNNNGSPERKISKIMQTNVVVNCVQYREPLLDNCPVETPI